MPSEARSLFSFVLTLSFHCINFIFFELPSRSTHSALLLLFPRTIFIFPLGPRFQLEFDSIPSIRCIGMRDLGCIWKLIRSSGRHFDLLVSEPFHVREQQKYLPPSNELAEILRAFRFFIRSWNEETQ